MHAPNILFVDDDPNILQSYKRSLRSYRDTWNMHFEPCPVNALKRMKDLHYDTVVSDVRMPGMTGLEFLEAIKADPEQTDVPVIIVTGEADKHLKRKALDLNAADLLNKPVETEDLAARIHSVLRLKQYSDELKEVNDTLERKVQERTTELYASRIDILWRLGKAAEFRDEDTGNHVIRVGSYSRIVAQVMGLNDAYCENLFLAAPLHDIGKIGIPDAVLLKPGKLDDAEWDMMRSHCVKGVAILTEPCNLLHVVSGDSDEEAYSNPVLEMAAVIAESHHEKWDGSGYPHGLAGEEIPLVGRIVAIADVYDALRSHRPYKKPFPIEKALDILREGSGKHFDPDVVEAFLAGFDAIREIEEQFSDAEETEPALPPIVAAQMDLAPQPQPQ